MKMIKLLFVGCTLFCLTGCLDMVEEMTLNRDGSGNYSLTFDMSSILEDPMMKGMMEQMMQEQEGIDMGEDGLEQDTVIYFKDSPELAELYEENPEFWDNVKMHTIMSESKKKMKVSMQFDFKSIDDINYFYQNLQKMGEKNQVSGGFLPLSNKGLFSMKRKQLVRAPVEVDTTNKSNNEEMEMAKMFFATGTYQTIYHLPGKVKKSTIPDATMDGKTVSIRHSLLDVMDGKAKLDGMIKFK